MKKRAARWWIHAVGYGLMAVALWRLLPTDTPNMWSVTLFGLVFVPGMILAIPTVVKRVVDPLAPYLPFIEDPDQEDDDD